MSRAPLPPPITEATASAVVAGATEAVASSASSRARSSVIDSLAIRSISAIGVAGISADGNARHKQVVELLDLVKLNGVKNFALNVELPTEP